MQLGQVSWFRKFTETNRPFHFSLERILEEIRTSVQLKGLIDSLHELQTKEERDNFKLLNLPCILFGGTFSYRNEKSCIDASGIACLDYDTDTLDLYEKLKSDTYTLALFKSPTYRGYKQLIKIPHSKTDYKNYYLGAVAYYRELTGLEKKKEVDSIPQNIASICFASYDPDLYYNPDALVFTEKVERQAFIRAEKPPLLPVTKESEIYDKLKKWLEKKEVFEDGTKNIFTFKLAAACNRFGLSHSFTEMAILNDYDFRDEAKAKKTIKSAYSHTDQHNTEYFEDDEALNNTKKLMRSGGNAKDFLTEVKGVEDEKAKEIIFEIQSEIDEICDTFWEFTAKGKVVFLWDNFVKWLANNQVYRMQVGQDWEIVKIDNNRVSIFPLDDMLDYVVSYVKGHEDNKANRLVEFMRSKAKMLMDRNYLVNIGKSEIPFLRDTEDSTYLYFQNVVVRITDGNVELLDYLYLDGCIWESQVIEREFTQLKAEQYKDCDFARFVRSVNKSDPERFKPMQTAIGYLLNNYKNSRESKAVILTDELISDDPNGGTGKGIFVNALKHFRKVTPIDGKTFSFDKPFMYQRVDIDSQIISFEDTGPNFDFERLFSVITDGIEVEKKNKQSFYIPFSKSPKIIVTTNYALKGMGNSHERRRIEIEFTQYFNKDHTPFDEFGRMMFDGWCNREWLLFDNYIVRCCLLYLKEGVLKPKQINMPIKNLIANTNKDFVDWIQDQELPPITYKTEAKESFLRIYPDYKYKTYFDQRMFNKWMSKWFAYTGAKVTDSHNNGVHFWRILDNGYINESTDTKDKNMVSVATI